MSENQVLQALLTRHSVKPKYLTQPAPSAIELELCARAAMRAPDHGRLKPYRFVTIAESQRETLAALFATAAKRQGASEDKIERARSKAKKGPAIVAFIFIDSPENTIPTTEKMLTAGAALDQFMLALQAQGYGGIILSGSILEDEQLQKAFCHTPNERLLAWITVGTPSADAPSLIDDTTPAPIGAWDACI